MKHATGTERETTMDTATFGSLLISGIIVLTIVIASLATRPR